MEYSAKHRKNGKNTATSLAKYFMKLDLHAGTL